LSKSILVLLASQKMVTLTFKYSLLAFCAILVFGSRVPAQNNPITKRNLLESLRIGAVTAKEYSEIIRKHRVDFRITAEDERQIRRAGKYLGKKGLDQVIAAVRDSYIFAAKSVDTSQRPETRRPLYQQPGPPWPRADSGNSNVPGRQSNLFVQVFIVKIAVSVKVEEDKQIQGLHDTSAYFTLGDQALRLTPDSNITVETPDPRRSIATTRYLLDPQNPIIGKPIFFLSMIQRLTINYSKIFQQQKLAIANGSSGFELSLILNDEEYSLETPNVTQELLASGELSFDIHDALTALIYQTVQKNIKKVTVTSVSPNHLEQARSVIVPVTIRGEGFQQGLLLFLICKNGPSQTISPGQIAKMSPTELIVTINNYAGFSGSCLLSVQNPDGGRSNAIEFTFSQ
jgi:hypothetical protein